MAEGGSTGQDISFVWENESWALSNSDNYAGTDENLGKDAQNNNSNCPTPREMAEADYGGPGLPAGKRKKRSEKQPGGDQQGNHDEAAGGGVKGGELDHELHIWTERERRKKMRSMFSNLQALMPQLPPKADKFTIVDEAANYIRTLQQTLRRLQKQKLEILQGQTAMNYEPHRVAAMESREAFLADQGSSSREMTISPLAVSRYSTVFSTWAAPNMVLSVCGDKAQINICCPKKHGLFSAICFFLEKHKLQVLSAHVSCDHYRNMYMIQAHASGSVDQLSQSLSIDDIFQLATGEIMMYMASL